MKIGKLELNIKSILLIIVVILVLIIIIQNVEPCNVRLLFIRIENIPKFLLIAISILLGMGIQALVGILKKKK